MKKILISCLLLLGLYSEAQASPDSLWNIWNNENAPDSNRALALRKIVTDFYLFSQPDSAFYFSQILVEFNEQKNLRKELAKALSLQGISYFVRSDYLNAMEYYQKCLKIYEEIGDKKGISNAMNNIGLIYWNQDDYDQAIAYYQKSIVIKEEISDKKGMAKAMSNIGNIYSKKGDHLNAMKYFQAALKIKEEISDKKGVAAVLINIANIYLNQGNYPKSLSYYQRSLRIHEEIANKRGVAQVLNNIGLIYMEQGEYAKAIDLYQKSLEIKVEISDKKGVAQTLNNLGSTYIELGDYTEAKNYFQRSIKIKEEISDKSGIANTLTNIGIIYSKEGDYLKAEEYYKRCLNIYMELADKKGIAFSMSNMGIVSNKLGHPVRAIDWCIKSLQISEETNNLEEQKEACQCLYDAYKTTGNNKKALSFHERITLLNDSLQVEETAKKLQQMEFARQMLADSLLQEEERLRVQLANTKEVQKKIRIRNISIVSALFLLLGAVALHQRMIRNRRAKRAIEKEKARSDNLLLNILPSEIAEELKEKGRADPRKFDNVSILFSDFKDFTQISEKLSAKELVGEINTCFKPFDVICKKLKIEKIKTIGDSYMAAGGLPVPSEDSVKNTVIAGINMQEFIIHRKKERAAEGKDYFEMRVGIHTGPIIAGIVGVSKFQYDIWGDAVNTASRMESAGAVDKVNISSSTYEMIKNDPAFKFHSRGKINVKGKGDIEMWFVEKA